MARAVALQAIGLGFKSPYLHSKRLTSRLIVTESDGAIERRVAKLAVEYKGCTKCHGVP